MMSVEMVRRYVQNSADLRAEFVDRLQLETADLCHRNCIAYCVYGSPIFPTTNTLS